MSLIFGSTALKHWFPDLDREPKDLDLISKEQIMTETEQHYWSEAFRYILENNKDSKYVDPNFLYTIKVSHAAWDIWWDKTMHDVGFMRRKGCVLDRTLFDLLYKEWEITHRQKRINLNVKNDEFFTTAVTRKYDHDWLHSYLAFGQSPMHDRIRPDPAKAYCSQKLWNLLSDDDKLRCAMEEVYVIATERFIVRKMPPRFSKYKAVRNLITSATKGWFNLFLIENFHNILNYDDSHWQSKLEQLKNET